MLFWDYPLISKNYFILCFVVILGTLQWAAARNHKPAISLLGAWGLGWGGKLLGCTLVMGGFLWFFSTTPGLFASGLAGGELSTLFSAGGLSALVVARLAGAFWQNRTRFWIYDFGFWIYDAWRGFTFYVLRFRLKKFKRSVQNRKQEV